MDDSMIGRSAAPTSTAIGKHWTVEDVSRMQQLLGRVEPLADVPHRTADRAPDALPGATTVDGTTPVLHDVSGRYRSGGALHLELRVDVDGIRPMRRVSGDFFQTTGGTVTHVGSFVVHTPVIQVTTSDVTIDGAGIFQHTNRRPASSSHHPPYTRVHAATQRKRAIHDDEWCDRGPYSCQFESPFFRRVEFEQDFVQSVTRFVEYDTASLPSGGPGTGVVSGPCVW